MKQGKCEQEERTRKIRREVTAMEVTESPEHKPPNMEDSRDDKNSLVAAKKE